MPQIILKERTAHLASYIFFTRHVDQYQSTSLSQLYQPSRTPFSQNTYHQLLLFAKFLRTAFLWNTSGSSTLQIFLKIGVVKSFADFIEKHYVVKIGVTKSFANVIEKHLELELLFKNLACSCNFIKKRLQQRCFPVKVAKFLRTPFFYRTPPLLHLWCLLLYSFF